jgi:hypothetical protein
MDRNHTLLIPNEALPRYHLVGQSRSFGKSKTAAVLQKEARKMFNNAR